MANPAAPQPKDNMGAPEPRYDARLKVTGQARYSSDTPLANPAYAVLVTSTIANGTLRSLELEDARAVPGVLEIFTADDMSDLKTVAFGARCSTSIQKLGPEIQHAGQIIAVVVADTFEAATEGAQRVKADYSEATPSPRSTRRAWTSPMPPRNPRRIGMCRRPATPQAQSPAPMWFLMANMPPRPSITIRSNCSRRHAPGAATG
jgi:xanthine dehydrogenase molybdopterin-binding subunit B